jgi:hypothetical protein
MAPAVSGLLSECSQTSAECCTIEGMSSQPAVRRARPYRLARDRRRFLALAASGLVGGLVLRLDREAQGALGDAAQRFILYNHGNGLQKMHLDKSQVRSPSDFTLASFMSHFEPHQAELTVLQNFYCTPGTYLHGNASSALSCADRGQPEGASGIAEIVVGGPTFDQVIADAISTEARLRTLVLGHPFRITDGNCVQGTVVGRARNEPVFPTLNAKEAHELVFGVSGQDEVLVARRKSFLDFLQDDIQSFHSELPNSERQKLEQYLESVREVERAYAGGGLGCPQLGAQDFEQREAADFEGAVNSANNPAFWRYMCDLAVAALQCDAARQVSMLHTYGCVHFMYEFDGKRRNHHEDVAHTDEAGSYMEQLLGFHAEHVAYMYGKLKAVPEGTGTMADNLLMVWMSDGGGQHHDGTRTHPMIYLGNAGGRLKSGQWLKFEEGRYSLACAHLTTLRALGLDVATFGDGTDACNGPVPGVLA